MLRNVGLADAAGIGARRMQEASAGAPGAIDEFFVENHKIVGVVVVLLADHVNEAGPAVTDADDLIAFANGAKRDAADRGIEPGNVTTAGEYADDTFLRVYAYHEYVTRSFAECGTAGQRSRARRGVSLLRWFKRIRGSL